jgi:ketosteroid isomerase-like protein
MNERSPMKLPEPLSAYFAASNAHDSAALVRCFAADATVHDEGKDMHGLAAIRAWNDQNVRKYQVTTEPTDVKRDGDMTVVTVQVSGTFDGSPIELHFRFKMAGAKIEALDIG